MKKKVFGRKLSRNYGARKGLKYTLTRAFVFSGKIKTTKTKVKFVQREIEKLVTLAISDNKNAYRIILSKVRNDKNLADKIYALKATLKGDRKCGFTRYIPLVSRKGDNASMARLEWVTTPETTDKKSKESKLGKESKERKISNKSKSGKTGKSSNAGNTSKTEGKKVRKGLLGKLSAGKLKN